MKVWGIGKKDGEYNYCPSAIVVAPTAEGACNVSPGGGVWDEQRSAWFYKSIYGGPSDTLSEREYWPSPAEVEAIEIGEALPRFSTEAVLMVNYESNRDRALRVGFYNPELDYLDMDLLMLAEAKASDGGMTLSELIRQALRKELGRAA